MERGGTKGQGDLQEISYLAVAGLAMRSLFKFLLPENAQKLLTLRYTDCACTRLATVTAWQLHGGPTKHLTFFSPSDPSVC